MDAWIDVALEAVFPDGTCRRLEVGGRPVAVFNIDGAFYAIEDLCSHQEVNLSEGELDGLTIICPGHGARFSLVTGEALSPPAYESVLTLPVRVKDGVVQVCDDQF
ncbi:MAG: Rieske (2Fe-2S) region [Proteobacteria bacterium]|nr:Rieske (2Fe-2S) region [Pseudomonadota bacterium]